MKISDKLEYSEGKCQVCSRSKKTLVKTTRENKKYIEWYGIKLIRQNKIKAICANCLSKSYQDLQEKLNSKEDQES